MVGSKWSKLFRGNPILAAGAGGSTRVKRSMTGTKSSSLLVWLACAPIIILSIPLINAAGMARQSWVVLLMLAAVVQQFLVPAVFYSAVAGERERGSWDLLRVAPVTTHQVLVGKLLIGLRVLLPWIIINAVVVLLCVLSQDNQRVSYYSSYSYSSLPPYESPSPFLGLGILFSNTLAVAALTIFFSSRMKRPFSALMSTYVILILINVIVPLMASIVAGPGPGLGRLSIQIGVVGQLMELQSYRSPEYSPIFIGGELFMVLSVLAAVLLAGWAATTLDFADRNVKFITKKEAK
ncbi:MAG: hypothetical protein JST35_07545 [Armatimonadetes bacterium]|nr:hypothetical protein [Armatimonadota bacterium]